MPSFDTLDTGLLVRFGPLGFITASFCWGALRSLPVTENLSAWYGPAGLVALLTVLGLGIAGFVIASRKGPTHPHP